MEYDKENGILKAADNKILVRKSDGMMYGSSVTLGQTWYVDGKKLDEPRVETPDDFEEQDIPENLMGDIEQQL